MMKRKAVKHNSMFLHLTIAFMVIGLLPLLILSGIFVKRYSDNMREVVINNASSQSLYISTNIAEKINDYDKVLRYLYDYNSEDYLYFYQLLKDDTLTSGQRANKIETVLNTMLYMDNYIEGVRFIDTSNRLYSVYKDSTKNIYGKIMLFDSITRLGNSNYKKLYYYSTYPEKKYYYPSSQYLFSLARYYMDTTSVSTTNNSVLGTVYIDINILKLQSFINEIKLYGNYNVYIVSKDNGAYIYSSDVQKYGTNFEDIKRINKAFDKEYVSVKDYLLVHRDIGNSGWMVVIQIFNDDIFQIYKSNITYFIIVLICVFVVLMVINIISSRTISRPAREMKNVMMEIEKGNLDVRIDNNSKDEMGYLADGLNNMVDNLKKYISKVYIAEIKQREAQLDALKTQINPHYLYNTLDVIRMTALNNNDENVVSMLDSLSSQLHYTIGHNSDTVPLRRELENIKEYFVLVKIRHQNNIDLEIDVNKEDMELYVMKLLLQPIVENAVIHGFKDKRETGRIKIRTNRKADYLEVIVMDDGAGISPEKLKEINNLLNSEAMGHRTEKGWSGIGVKNVFDRIINNYGNEYGIEITSCENLGTIVKCKLPIIDSL